MSNEVLIHYGVLGMRWGIRKRVDSVRVSRAKKEARQAKTEFKQMKRTFGSADVQEVNYRFAKRAVSDAKILDKLGRKEKSAYQIKMEAVYKNRGMNDDEAAVAAYKNIRTKKVLGAVAAAGVAYGAYKLYDHNVDKLIKSNTVLKNVSADSTQSIRDAFYSVKNEKDADMYRGLYGRQLMARPDAKGVYEKSIKVLSDIKQASPKNAQKVLSELVANDPKFAEQLEYALNNTPLRNNISQWAMFEKASNSVAKGVVNKNVYEALNIALVDHNPRQQVVNEKFLNALVTKGYNAIRDVNDSKYSGYGVKNPLITFGASKKVAVDAVKQIDTNTVVKKAAKGMGKVYSRAIAKEAGIYAGGFAAAVGAVRTLSAKADSKMVRKYRQEHPESKLTYTDIVKAQRKKEALALNGGYY
jgi:hypothetical protein